MSSEVKKKWRVVQLDVEPHQEELAGWLMMQLGANGCQVESQKSGPYKLQATFELDVLPEGDLSAVVAALDEYGLNSCIASLRTNELVEEDWLSKWKEGFEPFPIGERLLVSPPWHLQSLTPQQKGDRKIIVIEPGLAFGTGFHETTRFCLVEMQQFVSDAKRIIDVGTGSGILAIGAALLTADSEIVAIETDPVACKNAAENLAINEVRDRIKLFEGTTEQWLAGNSGEFDLLLLNLTYEDHIALLPDYVKLAAPGSHLVFAGILNEKADLMEAALNKHGMRVLKRTPGKTFTGVLAKNAG